MNIIRRVVFTFIVFRGIECLLEKVDRPFRNKYLRSVPEMDFTLTCDL